MSKYNDWVNLLIGYAYWVRLGSGSQWLPFIWMSSTAPLLGTPSASQAFTIASLTASKTQPQQD